MNLKWNEPHARAEMLRLCRKYPGIVVQDASGPEDRGMCAGELGEFWYVHENGRKEKLQDYGQSTFFWKIAEWSPKPKEPERFVPGYHLRPIAVRGELGEISKMEEELDELREAMEQDNKIMAAVELSDLLGAMRLFMEKYLPDLEIEDLVKMNDATRRAFENGKRKPKEDENG